MAKQQQSPSIGPDHPMSLAGFIHEAEVCKTFGFAWSTWERDYRTKIPGRTFPSGRWFHRDDLVQWFKDNTKTGSEVTE
ncbi:MULTISPECIES: hypothetical protein [Rhodopirellula]|jgi:hypothetical protein|uniref:hypothetical protein n=1 Tax=Rhodopirellula TaxID=265488 RepID=UPI001303FAEF|nr:hypothetical protein [Rhodopirellula bahusiensis]|tara:strand:- start:28481 stop:28717 length:237 start_codon:yes stop_codon:yes gene_type:complete